MFYKTSDGCVNLANVTHITQTRMVGEYKNEFHLIGGDSVYHNSDEEDLALPGAMIPALPGFFLLSPADNGEGALYAFGQPIVGWVLSGEGSFVLPPSEGVPRCAVPVGIDDEAPVGDAAILMPDGRVFVPYDGTYDSEEFWLASEREKRALEGRKLKSAKREMA